jgi:hypothetical protein
MSSPFMGLCMPQGKAFGSAFQFDDGILYSYGIWGWDVEGDSSNYRELNNLITALEQHLVDGTLHGSEVFVFTNNTTTESAVYEGNTTSKRLFSLVC